MPINVEPGATGLPEPERGIPELPTNTITIKDGKVVRYQRWVQWNGEPWPTETITRNADGTFHGSFGDPEHGGASVKGTLDNILTGLNDRHLRELFTREGLTVEMIQQMANFKNFTITAQIQ